MDTHETRSIDELSDEKRCLLIGERFWIYRQPGGCVEIGERDDAEVDLVHLCEDADLDAVIAGLQAVRDRVPQRF